MPRQVEGENAVLGGSQGGGENLVEDSAAGAVAVDEEENWMDRRRVA